MERRKLMSNENMDGRRDRKPKGWWARFLERMARANEEALKKGCRS
jgi:hypothetical protein